MVITIKQKDKMNPSDFRSLIRSVLIGIITENIQKANNNIRTEILEEASMMNHH